MFQPSSGDVVFRRGDMMMYCDSAIFFSTAASDSMEAYGSIRMEQGDTLFLYGDWLEYSGSLALATVYADDAAGTVGLTGPDGSSLSPRLPEAADDGAVGVPAMAAVRQVITRPRMPTSTATCGLKASPKRATACGYSPTPFPTTPTPA